MAYSWSDPNASNATAAMLGENVKLDSASIGPILNALLQYRENKQRQQQQSYNDMLSGIAKGAAGFANNYQQGQANDAANAAIYASQYGNVDPYGGFTDPNRVPDYGGTDALRALQYAQKMNPDAYGSDYDKMLKEAKIDATDALISQRMGWTTPQQPTTPQTYTDDQGREWRLGAGGHWYPMRSASSGGVKMSQKDKDAVASLAPEYEPQVVYPPPPAQSQSPAQAGVKQSDVDQAAQAMQAAPTPSHNIPDNIDKANSSTVVDVANPKEAALLKPGTPYRTPDGRIFIR